MILYSSILRFRDVVGCLYLNEIYIDMFWRKRLLFGLSGVNFRPLKYRFLNSSRSIYFFLFFLWLPILVVFNFYLFLRSIFFTVVDGSILSGRSVWLESSLKSERIRDASGLVDLWVVDVRQHEYFVFLSRVDRVCMFLVAIYIIAFRSSLVNFSNKIQLIDVYRVLCFLEFVSRINGRVSELHICNHYDRWAMACFEGFAKGVDVWQHGVLDGSLDLPVKLKNIRCIHSFSLKESELWRRYLVDADVKFVIQESNFIFTSRIKKIDVLLISHPAYIFEEIEFLMCVLNDGASMSVAYKPHPAYDYSNVLPRLNAVGVDVVPPNEYPEAALAITKGSTLGHEYERAGVSVIWWGSESFPDLLGIIKARLFVKI